MSTRRPSWNLRRRLAAWMGLVALVTAQLAPLSFASHVGDAGRAAMALSRLLGTPVSVCAASDLPADTGNRDHAPHCVFCLPVGGHAPGLPSAVAVLTPALTETSSPLPNRPVASVHVSAPHSPSAPRAPPALA